MSPITDSDRQQKALDFAQDLTKLLITLATGVITLTITFLKDVVSVAPESARKYVEIAWLLYLLSIVGGVGALMGMTSSLFKDSLPSIYGRNVTVPSIAQFLLFGAALGLTIYFGMEALDTPGANAPAEPTSTPAP